MRGLPLAARHLGTVSNARLDERIHLQSRGNGSADSGEFRKNDWGMIMRVHFRWIDDQLGAKVSKRVMLIPVAAATLVCVVGIAGCDRTGDPEAPPEAAVRDSFAADESSDEPDFHHSSELSDEHRRMMNSHAGDPDHHEDDSSGTHRRRSEMHGRDGQ